jgi:hypothetical protein
MEGQDRLKLVTFCRDRDNYEQNTLKEYLAYRIHNLLTDESFQVRLASITYLDVAGRDSPVERWGFVIEANEELAARLGGEVWEPEEDVVNPGRIPTPSAISVALFQYFIGNTDFSIYARHNMVLVDSSDRGVVAVPYDFDWSGLVSAPYATPDASLGTRTVRDRLYRELCRPGVDFQAYFAHYQSKRAEIEALIRDQVGLSENTVRPRPGPGHHLLPRHRLRPTGAGCGARPSRSSPSTSPAPAGSSTTPARSGTQLAVARGALPRRGPAHATWRPSASRTSARPPSSGTAAPGSRSTTPSSGRTGGPRSSATASRGRARGAAPAEDRARPRPVLLGLQAPLAARPRGRRARAPRPASSPSARSTAGSSGT